MPLHALVDGVMTRAERIGPRAAECFECGDPMIAKTGDIITWHWAHRSENPACGLSAESEWHLAWKGRGLPGTQEIRSENGKRRADVLSPTGFAVEFQRSPLTWKEVREREHDWEHRLVWVLDATSALRARSIEPRGDALTRLTWWRCPATASACIAKFSPDPEVRFYPGCRTFLDLGEDIGLFYAQYREQVYDRGSSAEEVYGQLITGWRVTTEAFVRNVLHGTDPQPLSAMTLRPDLWQPEPKPLGPLPEEWE